MEGGSHIIIFYLKCKIKEVKITQRNRQTKILEENFVKSILERKTKTNKQTNQKGQAMAM